MNKKQKYEFARWGASNWNVLEEMHEDYLSFAPKSKLPLHLFMLMMWQLQDGDELVTQWEKVKHQKMLERN